MDKNAAATLIKDTLQQPFDKARYTAFVKNLLNTIDEEKAFSYFGQYVPEKFRDFVKGYERIGTYTDPSDQKIDVLIVYLKNDATLARARTSQRNFISNYLKTRDAKDAGLIAFVAPNPEEWRFSFVKMEYKLVEKKGKVRAEEEFTPARRYSFLVGQHESSHTAQHQLLPILADDKHNPTLEIIENAFNIETVTKEFFEKYRELFLQVKEALDALAEGNAALKKEFENKNVNTADFAKKLLGQIVFLYFLQKKGWFGVERDSAWGSGPKNFLRQLFEGKLMKYGNFFNDVLEPLFYEALAVEREANFYSKFNCKIPFLNGGLFDPLNSYDWVHTDITLPNELFSNDVRTKEGDVGTGILDMFDRYNFTVKEDEPLEKEVAVDPEMLGKVFENLLEVNDRKSKGTYYTPREIVHYMCQESLINYLATELEGTVSKDDITLLIQIGDTVVEHESRVMRKGEETETYSYKLPESVRKNAVLIDKELADIRVCDPAIGSGAFPVGMMNEIVRARQTLTSYLPANGDRLPYDFKRHAIQESLYGVDIDPGAVEIAKLRLWLSLIVDEDDIERIKPLPNLDYRIMQGNSLLEEFEGIRLFDERLLETTAEDKEKQLEEIRAKMGALQQEYFALHSEGKLTDIRKEEIEAEIKRQKSRQKQLVAQPKEEMAVNIGMFDTPNKVAEMLTELKGLHRAFFEATQRKKKEELKNKIEKLEWELVETSLTERNKGELLAKLKATHMRPFFLWKLYFFEVFQQKGGFDVVIANPPYLRIQEIQKYDPQLAKQLKDNYVSASGSFDLYVCFVELAISLINSAGNVSYILPHKFFQAAFGKQLRHLITSKNMLKKVVDFGSSQIFDNATTYTCLLFLSENSDPLEFAEFSPHIEKSDLHSGFRAILGKLGSVDEVIEVAKLPKEKIRENEWIFSVGNTLSILEKINAQPRRLGKIYTKMFQGIATSADDIYFLKFLSQENSKLIRVYSDALNCELLIEEAITKPLLKGADVHRYSPLVPSIRCIVPYKIDTDNAQLYSQDEIQELFPYAWDYLEKNRMILENREKGKMKHENYYAYIYPKNLTEFHQPKIITPEISLGCNMTYDDKGLFHNTKCYSFVFGEHIAEPVHFYLGLMNSKLLWYFLISTGYVLRGGYFTFKTNYLAPFPVPDNVGVEKIDELCRLVTEVLMINSQGGDFVKAKRLEREIDDLVYDLYEIDEIEKNIIEEAVKDAFQSKK